jgi:hypothetical protein
MIALLVDDRYFYDDKTNIRDFLISYAKFIGFDMKIFTILANSGEMSAKDLVEYINNRCYGSEEIVEIYEIGKKIY